MVVVQPRGSPTTNMFLRKIRVTNGKQVHQTRGTVAVQLRSSPAPSRATSKVITKTRISRAPPIRRGIDMKTGNRQTSGKRNSGETQNEVATCAQMLPNGWSYYVDCDFGRCRNCCMLTLTFFSTLVCSYPIGPKNCFCDRS